MTDFDFRLIDYLDTHTTSDIDEISDDLGCSEAHIQSRAKILEKFGICHVGGEGYQSRIDNKELQESESLIRNLSNRTVTWNPQKNIEWVDEDDLEVLRSLESVEQPATIHSIEDGSSSLERSKTLSKLTHAGLVEQATMDEFRITEKGKQAIEYEIGPFAATKSIIPLRSKPLQHLANHILALLDYFDPSTQNSIRDMDSASWQAEQIFHEQFHSKSLLYSITLIFGSFFAVFSVVGYLPIKLQPVGLLFDIVGAVFVALGLFRGRRGIAIESEELGGRFAGSIPLQPESVRAIVTSTLDGVFGTILLITGFTLQFIASTTMV